MTRFRCIAILVAGTFTIRPGPLQAGDPPPQPPEPSATPAPDDRSPESAEEAKEADAVARAVLVKAAERQGGGDLVPPAGSLDSVRILCKTVAFETERRNDEGGVTRTTVETDDDGLEVSWRKDQVRTVWILDGKKTQRGRFRRGDVMTSWFHDGDTTTLLAGDQHRADLEQVERDGRIVRVLLDVAVLRKMLADGSRWRIVDDATHVGIAAERTPPAGTADARKLTVWIDARSHHVLAAKVHPEKADGAALLCALEHDPDKELPAVRGAAVSFPWRFRVSEIAAGHGKRREIMAGSVSSVSFNTLTDADLTPPRVRR